MLGNVKILAEFFFRHSKSFRHVFSLGFVNHVDIGAVVVVVDGLHKRRRSGGTTRDFSLNSSRPFSSIWSPPVAGITRGF